MNLTQIKDEVARRRYDCTWKQALSFLTQADLEDVYVDVIIACQEQLRRDCAERAEVEYRKHLSEQARVDKQSILETPLIK